MKNRSRLRAAALAAFLVSAPAARADMAAPAARADMAAPAARSDMAAPAAALEEPSFYDDWIAGRLSLGVSLARGRVRHRHVPYDPKQENNFLGNINDMAEHGDAAVGFVVRYSLLPWLAVEAANDFRADLDARNMDGDSCDGTLRLRSWRAQAILLWPDESWAVRPWIGLGAEDVSASFAHADWWHLGWSSPESYARYGGGSKELRNGAERTMSVDDPGLSPVVSGGVSIRLCQHASLDAFARWTDCNDADVVFTRREGRREKTMRTGAFPAEHVAFGVALRAVF